jgi:hypothetical protein
MGEQTRIKCAAEGCSNTILQATAKANNGLCAPCLARKQKEERAKFIRENKREVDPFAGITDPVEILKILHTPRKYDPLIAYAPPPKPAEELYAELNKADAIRLMDIASKARLAGKDDFAGDIAKSLATLTIFPLDQMLKAWLSRNDFWPAIIFRNAGPEIRDAVVSALDADTTNANHALSALAWIGDAVVQDRFRRWDKENPPWRKKLYIPPSEYSTVAGWELTSSGRRNLFYKDCFAIKPATGEPDKTVKVMEPTNLACPWCNRELVNLIDLDLSDDRFRGLHLRLPKLPVLTCDACTCFGVVYASLGHDGEAHWAHENQRPKHLPGDLLSWEASPWRGVRVALHQRRAIEAVDWCLEPTVSQIGGLPSWVQDVEYPKCPDCHQVMSFIAQVDNGAFPLREGVYYAFLCSNCMMTATTYQQT